MCRIRKQALAAAEQAEIDARVQLEETLYQCMVRRPLRPFRRPF